MEPCTLTLQSAGLCSIPRTHAHDTSSRRCCRFAVTCRRQDSGEYRQLKRRYVLISPFLAGGVYAMRSALAKAEEKPAGEVEVNNPQRGKVDSPDGVGAEAVVEEDEMSGWRIYDATAIGEPMALGKENRKKVWEKMMDARVVYLGEAEQVPVRDDRELELEIVKNLRKRCMESERPLSLALEAFPCNLQEQLNQYMDKRIDGETLKSYVRHWSAQRWQEYEPLLTYCRDNGAQLIACGVPLEILRTVQSQGVRGLAKADRMKYAPPAGSGFTSAFPSISRRSAEALNFPNQSTPYGPSSYLSIQARAVEDYTMSEIILQSITDVGPTGMLVVVAGAGHVTYGSRGTGIPARIARKIQKRNQLVILLDPERQHIRREGEVPLADFLWYSAARPCSRNCFDRAEISRVMNAAGRRRDALPQDLQKGLDLGVVSPEVLQNFFDLEQYPLIAELTNRFQGFRERLLADPKFLYRLAIEETVSITTTLLAQYERRKENFFEELDYVITDTVRAAVVDFFTVWLPAPTLSIFSGVDGISQPSGLEGLKGLLVSIPDNAFQKNLAGNYWSLNQRIASVVVGGLKLAGVGIIASFGTVASSNGIYAVRKLLNPSLASKQLNKRAPMVKSALVYAVYLATTSNLRYQVISGIVEHRISEPFANQTLIANLISFVARTINCYWGAQQWVDLARYTGLQARISEEVKLQALDSSSSTAIECKIVDDSQMDETNQ